MPDAPARPFRLTLTDGRTFEGAQFDDGFVFVRYPGEYGRPCTIALDLTALLDETEDPALRGAEVTWHH